jgi:hypothetical protein
MSNNPAVHQLAAKHHFTALLHLHFTPYNCSFLHSYPVPHYFLPHELML